MDYDTAYELTNPNRSDEEREQSARAIIAGTAANEMYWASRGTLEQLQARADGHNVIVRGDDQDPHPAIEGTATEDRQLTSGDTPQAAASPDVAEQLRAQLREANIEPGA